MSEFDAGDRDTLLVRSGQPLIGLIAEDNGEIVVRYFVGEAAFAQALPRGSRQAALDVAGAWSDLDWDEVEAALDRIRHESRPTPPIELDL